MYTNKDEIKIVEDWHIEMVDMKTGMPVTHFPTGTGVRMEKRRIQNIYGKPVHIPDDGELEVISGDCGSLQVRLRCRVCGKEFCADY